MRIRKVKNYFDWFNEKTKKVINIFYKKNYKYTVEIIENTNILIVTKEDLKSEYFEIEIFEII